MSLTLARYAAAKHLPIGFLATLGLRDMHAGVGIPYPNRDGRIYTIRTRLSLTGKLKVLQPRGVPLIPYGLDRLGEGRDLIVVEGESDCHALWLHGFAALGLPGAGVWKSDWRTYLTSYDRVYLYDEGDTASRSLARKMAADFPGVRSLRVGDYKDPSDLQITAPDDFDRLMREAMRKAPTIRPRRRRFARPRPARNGRYGDDLDIMAAVAPYVRLRRSGSQWRGLCPFHEERDPSFYVSPKKAVWFCHGCGRGGGVKEFLRLVGAR